LQLGLPSSVETTLIFYIVHTHILTGLWLLE